MSAGRTNAALEEAGAHQKKVGLARVPVACSPVMLQNRAKPLPNTGVMPLDPLLSKTMSQVSFSCQEKTSARYSTAAVGERPRLPEE